ncbi:MAG: hypothetical protein IPI30_21570 [Saprospiraceae bacterium]|nr:hypothetical protein [Candidatus Vicinibacter affinis]
MAAATSGGGMTNKNLPHCEIPPCSVQALMQIIFVPSPVPFREYFIRINAGVSCPCLMKYQRLNLRKPAMGSVGPPSLDS